MSDVGRRQSLLRHRDFVVFWTGESISDTGTAVTAVVLPLVAIVYLHASAFEVGALAAAQRLPWLLIGLLAGVWVDRSPRRTLMLCSDAVRVLAVGSVPLAAALGGLTIGQLFGVAAVVGFATVVFQVADQAYMPVLVDAADLPEASSKVQGSQAVANVVGPGLGGLLVQILRAPYALVVDAASYLVSFGALLAVRRREPEPPPKPDRRLRTEIAEGARYVRADPLLRVMTIAPALANFFYSGFGAIEVLFLVRGVHLAPSSVGVLIGVVSLGSVVGALVARPLGRWLGTARLVWMSIIVTAPFGLLIPLTTRGLGLAWFVVGTVVVLTGILAYNVTIVPFRQVYCPPQVLGRVVATMRFVLFGTVPLGGLAAGVLASVMSVRVAALVLLIGNLLSGLVLVGSPLRRMRDLPTEQTGERAVSPAHR